MESIYISLVVDVVSAVGVILTMLFVGLELRRQNIENGLANTREQLTMLMTFKSQTNEPYMADLVCRGRKDFMQLSESEKITFELYLEQAIHATMAVYYHSGFDSTDADASIQSCNRHLRDILDHPGTREWWLQRRKNSPLIDFGRSYIDQILGIED